MHAVLATILMAVMTWTVETKNSVSLSDNSIVPYSVEVSYSNTYNKGQVRQDDVATLTLSHLGGITISGIEVYVKSNKSAGAGEFTVTANGRVVATKSGTLRDWTGNYDNTDYHAISLLTSPVNSINDLVITLTGVVSSLYIEKYVITYTPRPAYTVTLQNGNRIHTTMTEESGMRGVELPALPDTADWQFIGWSETEIWNVRVMPAIHNAGTMFYPEHDCTLWATYRYSETPDLTYVTDLETGVYMYVNSVAGIALKGAPVDGKMETSIADFSDEEQRYNINFTSDTTATITHEQTGTPIGYTSDAKMAQTASIWRVYHEGEETLFYTIIGGKIYVLWLNIMDQAGENFHAGLMRGIINGDSPMRLRATAFTSAQDNMFTCHPEAPQATEQVPATKEGITLHFGNYELQIIDRKKYLRLR